MELRCDVVVVGAGAAGMAAARVLSRAGASAVVLEARERIGGRLHTREDAGPVPIELGSEFVHGPAGVSFDLLRAADTVAIDTGGAAFMFEDGELRESEEDPFDIASRVIAGASTLPGDVSIDAFLATLPAGAAAERERRWTRLLVEGFDAADPARASTRALAEEWGSGEGGQTAEQFRPLGGYARLMRTLHGALDPALVHVRLGSPAHTVRRDAEGVVVEARSPAGAPLEARARAAIVTLPAGVLQAGDVRFVPALPQPLRDALGAIVMGPVRKLVLRFRTAFWERLQDGRFRDAAFFHHAGGRFPAFWTQLPLRAQLLVAWAGGPKADALADRDEASVIALALDDLRILFGSEVDPQAELVAAYTHDWQRDPYARGAYSYVAVGGSAARAQLAAPVDGVLFFAGEATAPASEAGTVAGALQSGERAAREALAAL